MSNQLLNSYKSHRLGLSDVSIENDFLYHLLEVFPHANPNELQNLVTQIVSSGSGCWKKADEIQNVLDIAGALTSRKRPRNARSGDYQTSVKKPSGDCYDPNDPLDEHLHRALAVFSHVVTRSDKLRNFDYALNAENIVDNVEIINCPGLERAYLNRKSSMTRGENRERLLFYPFFINDVDKILSNNFDARINGFDDLGGIPFSESPSLTIGHGTSSGLLLCRVLLGSTHTMTRQEVLAGKFNGIQNHSLTVNDPTILNPSDSLIYIVKDSDQILPYCIIRLKESFTSKGIEKYLTKNDITQQANATNGVIASSNLHPAHPILFGASAASLNPFAGNSFHHSTGNSHMSYLSSGIPSLATFLNSSHGAVGGGSFSSRVGHSTSRHTYPTSLNPVQPVPSHGPSTTGGATASGSAATTQNHDFVTTLTKLSEDLKKENCCFCTFELNEKSMFDDDSTDDGSNLDQKWSQLKGCGHTFHELCFSKMMAGKSFLQCPQCKRVYGQKTGTQPVGGHMNIRTTRGSLAGFENCGTIEVHYYFKRGIQGPEHPHPGRPYHPIGFPRITYFPDNEKGQKVVKLLQKAFDRRLIFTVGRSVTTGADDAVTWNDIHHKTTPVPGSTHGYPDPAFLDNILDELAQNGVIDE